MSFYKISGRIVGLKTHPETILRRVSADEATFLRRRNLTKSGGLTEIEEVLTKRTPIYRRCAVLEVDTENMAYAEVATAHSRYQRTCLA